jgi:hypothetical protein
MIRNALSAQTNKLPSSRTMSTGSRGIFEFENLNYAERKIINNIWDVIGNFDDIRMKSDTNFLLVWPSNVILPRSIF